MPHSTFIFFAFGVIIGVLYFFNNNIMIIVDSPTWIPFKFLVNVNAYFHRKSRFFLDFFSYLCIIIIIALAFNYYLIELIYKDVKDIEYNTLINLLKIYENKIAAFLFSFYLMLLIYRDNINAIKLNFNILIISRSSFAIIIMGNIISNTVYLKMLGRTGITISDLYTIIIFVSSYLLLIGIGVVCHVLYEQPFRSIYKKYLTKNK
jgi:hypothetical protein